MGDETAYDHVKRAIDVVVGGVALVASLPVQAVVAAAVLVAHGRPILFRQQRPGRGGAPFTILKFRTMRHPDAAHVTDAERLTGLGRFLRASSLDELPELVNVVRGDMSLVGPRPLLMEYLERYTPQQARRHEVRPGLTGLAQVAGRNKLTWEEKFALDVEYVERRSLALDVSIIARTIGMVLLRREISADGEATMPVFMGAGAAS